MIKVAIKILKQKHSSEPCYIYYLPNDEASHQEPILWIPCTQTMKTSCTLVYYRTQKDYSITK